MENNRLKNGKANQSAMAVICADCLSICDCILARDSRADNRDCAKSDKVINAVDWSADCADTFRTVSIWSSDEPEPDRSRTRARTARSSGVYVRLRFGVWGDKWRAKRADHLRTVAVDTFKLFAICPGVSISDSSKRSKSDFADV